MRSKLAMATAFLLAATLASASEPEEAQRQAEWPTHAAFEKLKSLIGLWDESPWSDEGGGRRVVQYRLTGDGTSLIEEFTGDPAMTTVYHMDGNELRMTHFCNAGNQPRMKATFWDGGDSIQFEFVDVTNLSSPEAYHTRTLRVEFIDEDHVDLHFVGLKQGRDVPGTVSLTRREK